MTIDNNTKVTIGTVIALVGCVLGAISFMDAKHVSIDAYAADQDKQKLLTKHDYRRDLQQDVNFYQMQKSILFSQRRSAPAEEVDEINDEIQVVNDNLKMTNEQLQELEHEQ